MLSIGIVGFSLAGGFIDIIFGWLIATVAGIVLGLTAAG